MSAMNLKCVFCPESINCRNFQRSNGQTLLIMLWGHVSYDIHGYNLPMQEKHKLINYVYYAHSYNYISGNVGKGTRLV